MPEPEVPVCLGCGKQIDDPDDYFCKYCQWENDDNESRGYYDTDDDDA